jgi:hypothetical protein
MLTDLDPEKTARMIAEAQARSARAQREYAETAVPPDRIGSRKGVVHAASILVWTRLAEMAGVPFIPAETVVSIPMSAVDKVMDDREADLDDAEIAALRRAADHCESGGYWRTDVCAPHDVKSAMARNLPMPDILPLVLDDPRMIDVHHNMPDVKIVARPRLTPVRHAGWPVEFRTFFGGRAEDGAASWYYPQAGGFDVTPGLEAAMDQAVAMGRRLHGLRHEMGLVPALPDAHLAGDEIGSTIDFMLTEERGVVLVDAGPGAGYGADPCCFMDDPVAGRRWRAPHGPETR